MTQYKLFAIIAAEIITIATTYLAIVRLWI
jgi:hypothetical protein